eukprot:COSAG02_NODE_37504_length_441_cov_0.760234_1_plen_25_part_10
MNFRIHFTISGLFDEPIGNRNMPSA